jgi:hypothetical protein
MSVKPTKPNTPSHDNVVRVYFKPTCPKCHQQFEASKLISVVTESWPDFERDDLRLPILDEHGNPKLKLKITPEYVAIPRVVDYEESQQDLLEPLLQRREKDMDLHAKTKEQLDSLREAKKKPKAEAKQEVPA